MFALDDSWDCAETAAPAAAEGGGEELEVLLERVELHGALPVAAPPIRKPQCKAAASDAPSTMAAAAVSSSAPPVELGFVSAYPGGPAQPNHFPSKVGGEPVWLLPDRLPSAERLSCGVCGRRLRFLMQLYCPRPEVAQAYHRSLMLFCCAGRCLQHASAWRALRCNLAVDTPWYTEEADGSWTAHGRGDGLGDGSGLPTAMLEDDAAGGGGDAFNRSASAEAAPSPATRTPLPPPLPPLPELLISVDIEREWESLVQASDADASAMARRLLAQYEAAEGAQWADLPAASAERSAKEERASASDSLADEEAMMEEEEGEMEEGFFAFQRRTSAYPEQALRYNRAPNGTPLWAGTRAKPPPGFPPQCELCGARRTFEFQLMPQLLCAIEAAEDERRSHTSQPAADALRAASDEDALDWGVVGVYTCSASCHVDACGYAVESVWHQPLA